jgi:O-glycosyl hydrolase
VAAPGRAAAGPDTCGGFRTKLVIPDDENPVDAYERAVAVLEDPVARQYVGGLTAHVYGAGGPRTGPG